jgi:hypothetical protein
MNAGTSHGSAMYPGGGGGGGPTGEGAPRTDRPAQRTCGAMDVHQRLLRSNPQYRAARDAIENLTLARQYQPGARRFPGVAKIPVVVHVV